MQIKLLNCEIEYCGKKGIYSNYAHVFSFLFKDNQKKVL